MKRSLPIKIKTVLLIIIALALVLLAGNILSHYLSNQTASQQRNGAPQGGDFTVSSTAGEVRLSDYKGKVVLLYFGYTYCPDICPTSLALMASTFKTLTKEELAQVQGLFVSVDPDRDNLPKLKQYAEFFHPKILGTSSHKANIDHIVKRYGAFYRKAETGSSAGYSVDHTSSTILIGKDGAIKAILPHGMTVDKLAEEIRQYL